MRETEYDFVGGVVVFYFLATFPGFIFMPSYPLFKKKKTKKVKDEKDGIFLSCYME